MDAIVPPELGLKSHELPSRVIQSKNLQLENWANVGRVLIRAGQRAARTVPTSHTNSVCSTSSAAPADLLNTARESTSLLVTFVWLMISFRMLLVPLGCHSNSGSLVTCTFPVGRCGSNTAQTAKQSHSNCDERQHHRPIVTLEQVFPKDHSSARNHRQLFSSPSLHNHHSHLRHTYLDAVSFQVFRT